MRSHRIAPRNIGSVRRRPGFALRTASIASLVVRMGLVMKATSTKNSRTSSRRVGADGAGRGRKYQGVSEDLRGLFFFALSAPTIRGFRFRICCWVASHRSLLVSRRLW